MTAIGCFHTWHCGAYHRGTHRLLEAALASTADGAGEQSRAIRGSAAAPQYVDFKDQIGAEMLVIDKKMTELRQLHGRAALTSFDDSNSSDVEIEVITQEITRLFRKCEVRLQQFGSGKSASEADEKVYIAGPKLCQHPYAYPSGSKQAGAWQSLQQGRH